jgi:hypothetical protein
MKKKHEIDYFRIKELKLIFLMIVFIALFKLILLGQKDDIVDVYDVAFFILLWTSRIIFRGKAWINHPERIKLVTLATSLLFVVIYLFKWSKNYVPNSFYEVYGTRDASWAVFFAVLYAAVGLMVGFFVSGIALTIYEYSKD